METGYITHTQAKEIIGDSRNESLDVAIGNFVDKRPVNTNTEVARQVIESNIYNTDPESVLGVFEAYEEIPHAEESPRTGNGILRHVAWLVIEKEVNSFVEDIEYHEKEKEDE